MPPRIDPRIPELFTLTEAAEILDCSKNWVTKLHQHGLLTGQRVGHALVFAAAPIQTLAAARSAGLEGWELPSEDLAAAELPELLSSTQAAERLGLAHRNWVSELYERGEIPGYEVGQRNVVFAAETIDEVAEDRRTGVHQYLNRAD